MPWIYADHLRINQDFIAVFSEEIDRQSPDAWKGFIPHKDMKAMLDTLVSALERGQPDHRRSLWIHGSYGTGKTFAAFVLKHLLEDDPAVVETYFSMYKLDSTLKRRLLALRERGKVLVVYRSSSAHLDSNRKLMAELQEAIQAALEASNLNGLATPTLYRAVLEKLEPGSAFNWPQAFRKHRAEFPSYQSPDEVLRALTQVRPGDPASTQAWRETGAALLERVCRVMDREGFVILDDPKDVKRWLKEVIETNGLKALVAIWDEFTDFFRRNPSTSGLQELAHATAEFPFYLTLITHRAPEVLPGQLDEDRQRLLERFHMIHYQMEPVTAYQLMRGALQVVPQPNSPWDTISDSLWDRVRALAGRLTNFNDRPADFKFLIPLHPYAAFLVSTVSRQFSSSQRTLFRFLKDSTTGSFVEFLRTYPRGDWMWYTADNLWDYFFADDEGELASRVRDVVSYYRAKEDALTNENDRRVFKAIVLLIALHHEMPVEQRVRPTSETLKELFRGSPLADRLPEVVKRLGQDGYIHVLPAGASEEYAIPLATVDPQVIEEIKRAGIPEFRVAMDATKPIGRELKPLFPPDVSVSRRRQVLSTHSADEFAQRRERLAPSLLPWQVAVVIIGAKTEDQLPQAEQHAAEAAAVTDRTIYVVLQSPFGQRRWDEWRTQKAYEKYYEDRRDERNKVFYQGKADALAAEWVGEVRHGQYKVYFGSRVEVASGIAGFDAAFDQAVALWFPYRPETISSLATLYDGGFGVAGARIGLGITQATDARNSSVVSSLTNSGFWQNDQAQIDIACRTHPDHPLARMRALVASTMSDPGGVNLKTLWRSLQAKPYGLAPNSIGIILFAWLMRPYHQGYYWSDGTNFFPLSADKLADLINAVMHGQSSPANPTIHRLTPEATEFCAMIRDIFNLPDANTQFPDSARDAVRSFLQLINYPLWALQHVPALFDRGGLRSLEELEEVVANTDPASNTMDNDRLLEVVEALRVDRDLLKQLIADRKFKDGMEAFLDACDPEILAAARALGLSTPDVVRSIREVMNEEIWLWRQTQVQVKLPGIKDDYRLIAALNGLLGHLDRSLSDSLIHLSGRLGSCKLPSEILVCGADPKIAAATSALSALCAGSCSGSQKRELIASLAEHRNLIRSHLDAPARALQSWVTGNLGVNLSEEEAREIWGGLDQDAASWDVSRFRLVVQDHLGALTRRRLAAELNELWRSVTGSDSPEHWSQLRKMPVQWVLPSDSFAQLLTALEHPEMATESGLRSALAALQDNAEDIGRFCSEGWARNQFRQTVAPQYADLLGDEDVVELQDRCLEQFGTPVRAWDQRRVSDQCLQWIRSSYQNTKYDSVVSAIDKAPQSELRSFLRDLATDPAIGAKIQRRWGGES